MNFFVSVFIIVLSFHYGFLLYTQFNPPPPPDCQTEIIEDKTNPEFDGRGHFDNIQYKPRSYFDPDRTGNIIGRFERFSPNQKQSDTELEQFVQMNSLQRM